MMTLRLRSEPARQRTGNVKEWLAILPSLTRCFGGLLDRQVVGQATMMVRVINQRHAFAAAERQQIGRRKSFVVVLHGQAGAGAGREQFEIAPEALQRRRLVAVTAAAVNVDCVGIRPFRKFRLRFNVCDRARHDVRFRRIEHDKLVGMKTGANALRAGELTAAAELRHNFIRAR